MLNGPAQVGLSNKVLYMPSACSKSRKPKKAEPPIVDLDGDNVDLGFLQGKKENPVNEAKHRKQFIFDDEPPVLGILVPSPGKDKKPKQTGKKAKTPEKTFTVHELDIVINETLKAAQKKGISLERITLKEIGSIINTAHKLFKDKIENPEINQDIELSESGIIQTRSGIKKATRISKIDMGFHSREFILSLKAAKEAAAKNGVTLQSLSLKDIWNIFQSAFKIQQGKLKKLQS